MVTITWLNEFVIPNVVDASIHMAISINKHITMTIIIAIIIRANSGLIVGTTSPHQVFKEMCGIFRGDKLCDCLIDPSILYSGHICLESRSQFINTCFLQGCLNCVDIVPMMCSICLFKKGAYYGHLDNQARARVYLPLQRFSLAIIRLHVLSP